MDDAGTSPIGSGSVSGRLGERLGAALAPVLGDAPAVRDFVRQAAEDLHEGEFPGADVRALGGVLARLWAAGDGRGGDDAPAIAVAAGQDLDGRPLGFDVLTIAQADRPFLVDSVMGELAELGLDVRAMTHPVVDAASGRRSLIAVVLDPVGEDRREAVVEGLRTTLGDVSLAVADHDAMRALMRRVTDELEAAGVSQGPAAREPERLAEDVAFLRWLSDDRFVFLGARTYEYPRDADGGYAAEEPRYGPESSLGMLRDQTRSVLRRASEPAVLTRQLARYLDGADPLVVAKSNLKSRVHRRVNLDYIGVKRYDAQGRATGETRFVGLFTLEAYDQPATEIPLIRRKVSGVLARAGHLPSAHTGKRLRSIVETYPRDELFQMSEDELLATARGVLHLYDRPRVRLFARRDPFDRFVSVMLYVPRDRYDSDVRQKAGELLAAAWNGRVSAYYPSFSAGPLARVHFILGVSPGDHPEPDLDTLQSQIDEATRTWRDRFEAALRGLGKQAGETGLLVGRYEGAFPPGYQARYDAQAALADVRVIEGLARDEAVRVRAYRDASCTPLQFRLKLYRPGAEVAPLSDIVPLLENMGLRTIEEEGYAVRRALAEPALVWVQELLVEDERGERLTFADVKAPFEAAFVAVWTGRTEDDGFNRLVLELGVDWREAALVRALAKYRQQTGLDPSQAVQTQALAGNPEVARLILELFRTRFDPARGGSADERQARGDQVFAQIVEALQAVSSLDHDRVLRRLALLVQATKRTNFYQTGEDGRPKRRISFKVASRELADVPAPKPFREIFVSAPHVEAVHLRFGPVARGGLRWSDRRDDFRTEVLGLVKAQQVKNAVIVPVGSKGGFFPKTLPRNGTADAVRAEGVRAYTTFLSGLLDITDTYAPSGEVVAPKDTVRHEGDDPYLVVAADKGTATFSDIANGISGDYGFWLGDAFASGGSVGYDHKAMGITARGAWEAVKRHFRELGKDIQSEPFTMIGVGDMSGDVFGNGALLSKQIKLVAAFDHRDIFLDPDPDPATSWAERDRMFRLPRSSWQDYDRALISDGGGVFSRSAKTVPVSAQVRAWLGIADAELSPADLIHAILKAQAELLYLGGIGTYVKATAESHADAGDKANDAVRVNADELRVKVVGEGANLGLTQAARIAYARGGGRINTDAIDNSAGVDTSDHEVNIKILLGQAIADGALKAEDRVALLASMTDEVAHHVLAHNYAQTLALSLQQQDAAAEIDAYAQFMTDLVAQGRLDRRVEGLPGPQAMADLAAAKLGLTRPELAVLTAYGKLELAAEIVEGAAPDDPWFERTLVDYFPHALHRFEAQMKRHRLRREIIATVLANAVVDWMGPTFAGRLRESAGADASRLVTAFAAAREVFRLTQSWEAVSALDGRAPAEAQLALYAEIARAARAHTFWLSQRGTSDRRGVGALVEAYQAAADAVARAGEDLLSPFEREAVEARCRAFVALGAPEALALQVARLRAATNTVELADLARDTGRSVEEAARMFYAAGARFGLDRLRAAAAALHAADPYEQSAVRGLIAEMVAQQVGLARAALDGAPAGADPAAALEAWEAPRAEPLARARRTLEEIEASPGDWTFAKLTIAHGALRTAAAQ